MRFCDAQQLGGDRKELKIDGYVKRDLELDG